MPPACIHDADLGFISLHCACHRYMYHTRALSIPPAYPSQHRVVYPPRRAALRQYPLQIVLNEIQQFQRQFMTLMVNKLL